MKNKIQIKLHGGNNMQKQKLILISLLATLMLVLPLVIAATTLNSPVNYGNYTTGSNNISFSVTVDAINNITNISCYYNASGGLTTENSTYKIVQMVNTSASQTSFTGSGTLPTAGTTYNITCFIYNITTVNSTKSVTNVRIDGTDPVVSISVDKPSTTVSGSEHTTWSSTDTGGSNLKSTTVTLTSPDTTRCSTQTWGNTSTQTDYLLDTTYLACAGTYTLDILASDHSGRSSTTSTTFQVYAPGAGGGSGMGSNIGTNIGTQNQKPKVDSKTIIILVIAGIVIYFIFKKK